MKREQRSKIMDFIRSRGRVPVIHAANLTAEIECLVHNTQNALATMRHSTKQRRERKAEIERLVHAFKGLSTDTRREVSMRLVRGICQARGVHSWTSDTRDADGVQKALAAAVGKVSREPRGAGHLADVKRRFVLDAARVFVLAGLDNVGANPDSVFVEWLFLLDAVFGLGMTEGGSMNAFQRAIREAIGKTAQGRSDWVRRAQVAIRRKYPQARHP